MIKYKVTKCYLGGRQPHIIIYDKDDFAEQLRLRTFIKPGIIVDILDTDPPTYRVGPINPKTYSLEEFEALCNRYLFLPYMKLEIIHKGGSVYRLETTEKLEGTVPYIYQEMTIPAKVEIVRKPRLEETLRETEAPIKCYICGKGCKSELPSGMPVCVSCCVNHLDPDEGCE
jgi:hypothetical protein